MFLGGCGISWRVYFPQKTTDTVTDGFFKVFHSKVVVFFFLWGGGVIKKKQVRNFFSKVF